MMDIGILVTNNLAWSKHIEWMTTKGNRTLGLVRRMCRHTVSLDVKKVLYCTLVRSRLEYACELWSPYTIKEKLRIENLQRRATRFILDYPQDMDYKQRLIKLSLLPLEYRRQIRDLIFLFKIRTGFLDIDHSCFLKQTTSSRYNTRNFPYLNYHVRLARQDYFKCSYFLRVTVLWNNLPEDLKCITLLTTFKREILNFFKTKLEHYCLPGK